MKANVLLSKLHEFEKNLDIFCDSWNYLKLFIKNSECSESVHSEFLNHHESIKIQSNKLLKQLGGLQLYIDYFDKEYYHQHISTNLRKAFSSSRVISSNFNNEKIKFNFSQIMFELQTNTVTTIIEIIGKLELMSPENDFILVSAPDYEYVYLKEVDKQININLDDLMVQYLDYLHPEIKKSSCKLFIDGHYQPAIHESIKAINQYLRDKTGSRLDGDNLYNTVFSSKSAILSFSGLSDVSGDITLNNEQLGFMDMLKGFSKGVRNVLAHNPAKPEYPQKAFEYLVMASLFCRRIDDTCKVTP